MENRYILSIQVNREKFKDTILKEINPRACFIYHKGVSAAKLHSLTPIKPIVTFNRSYKRFIEAQDFSYNEYTNIAAIHWKDFEYLIRSLFEKEFGVDSNDVKITQASRDGGVDAVIFDPDPIRGGKIIIQAKRYTNTVGVKIGRASWRERVCQDV